MSIGLVTVVREQVPANRLDRVQGYWFDMDDESVTVDYSTGDDPTYTFVQIVNWINANTDLTLTVAELVAQLDAECIWWCKADGSSPPEGGWPPGEQPGRGGRQ